MKSLLCFGVAVLLAACSGGKGGSAMNSETVFLHSLDADAGATTPERKPRGTPDPMAKSKAPTASPAPSAANVIASPAPREATEDLSYLEHVGKIAGGARSKPLSDPEQFSAMQARLLRRIDRLSNDQADSACLILQIIPREKVFDRSINPRAKLLDYAQQVNSLGDLHDIENAINNPKG